MSNQSARADDESTGSLSGWIPQSQADKERVREQLARILASSLFRNSKRFPVFLRYTVEHALASAESLKERTIGHEVFGREPGYDTSQDPVVRMTAAEVRKRLTQYYQSPERAAEPIIAYQPGSYVPEFFASAPSPTPETSGTPAPATLPSPPSEARRWVAMVAIVVLVVASAALLWRGHPTWRSAGPAVDAVARFWAPLVSSSSTVLICIGDPAVPRGDDDAPGDVVSKRPDDLTVRQFLRMNFVRYTDAVTLALLAGELRVSGKEFRIRRPQATELKDLRDGPVVLIGGFNNPWTLRLSEGQRFTLAADSAGTYIRDREHPDDRKWQHGDPSKPLKNISQTYGLITRVKDPATGHTVLTVSGLFLGTRAAGECVIDAECLEAAKRLGAADWEDRNLQIVVSAAVIGEDSGAPRVVAMHAW
jgi:hypothetical protein